MVDSLIEPALPPYPRRPITLFSDGCYIAPKCLECPLEVCILDDPTGPCRHFKDLRNQAIVGYVWIEGISYKDAAELFGVGVRTVTGIIGMPEVRLRRLYGHQGHGEGEGVVKTFQNGRRLVIFACGCQDVIDRS